MDKTILSRLGVNEDDQKQINVLRIFNRLFLLKLGLAIDEDLTELQRKEFNSLNIDNIQTITDWYLTNVPNGQATYDLVFSHTIDEVKNQILKK
jgi:hypothetical protein